jgi:hypothetical protein
MKSYNGDLTLKYNKLKLIIHEITILTYWPTTNKKSPFQIDGLFLFYNS